MKYFTKQILIFAAVALFVVSGCDFVGTVQDLMSLQKKITTEFEAEEINLNISDGEVLGVKLVNSPIYELDAEERAAEAKKIALFVKEKAKQPFQFSKVSVQFVAQEEFAVVKTTEAEAPYVFELETLEAAKPDSLKK